MVVITARYHNGLGECCTSRWKAGADSSPAFVRAPEGNGCAERFIRTLKEHLLWIRWFETVEELRQDLLEFQRAYNEKWIIARSIHGLPSLRSENEVL